IARDRELLNPRNCRVAGDNDFPVSLYGHTLTLSISVAAEVRIDFAGFIEIRVRTSICFETGECTLLFVFVCGVTGDNDSPIAIHGHTVAEVTGTDVGSRLAGSVKARIESPIRVVPNDRKIIVLAIDKRVAYDDDLSVTLYRYALCTAMLSDGGYYLSRVSEARVEASVVAVP